MGSIDDLPTIDDNRDTEAAAEAAFMVAIELGRRFLIQQRDRRDYGTDIQLEARDGASATNLRVHVQLKGTTQAANADDSVSVPVRRANLNYLLRQPDSLYACFHQPSGRLLYRFAQEVYREYEHRSGGWHHQDEITVRFAASFDEAFQEVLWARTLAAGKASLARRLDWSRTPPENLGSLLATQVHDIQVPPDPERAAALLGNLYERGHDRAISAHFDMFATVLDAGKGEMDIAYMAEVNLGLNSTLFDEQRVRDALEVLQAALHRGKVHPGSLLYCIGNAWLALREYERARETYLQALPLLDSEPLRECSAMCSKNMGAALRGLGLHDAERAFYERALELDPDLGEAHLALGLWHRAHGRDPALALDHLDRVVKRRGSALAMPTVQGWRVELLFRVGDAAAAFREIQVLLGDADNLAWVWPWCARQVAEHGRSSTVAAGLALKFWNRYLRKHPDDLFVLRETYFCESLLHQQQIKSTMTFAEFGTLARRLVSNEDSESALIWDRLGHWAQDEGDWVEAEAAYRRAYDLDQGRYGYCLGTALNFLDRFEEALPILEQKALVNQPDAMSWFQVAIAREGVGDFDGFADAYERAIRMDSDYAVAWFNLGGIYWNRQQIARAVEIWHEAIKRFPAHALAEKLRRDIPSFFGGHPHGMG